MLHLHFCLLVLEEIVFGSDEFCLRNKECFCVPKPKHTTVRVPLVGLSNLLLQVKSQPKDLKTTYTLG
uniref:Uncharacterized protein n=1 Tax=Setaria viridis TaxID=4556 RepID=A0A4U6VN79_SETVI|nr:hypothetical protein SEVIR_2G045148v2 [Setaria viridis]